MSKWCRRELNNLGVDIVTHISVTDPTPYYAANIIWYVCPDGIEVGNVFEDPIYRLATADDYYTPEAARAIRINDSELYAADLVDAAYANPQVDVTEDPGTYKRRVQTRREEKADKAAGEIALDQAEKDQAKTDQKLSEYEGKAWVTSDKVIVNINKTTTAQEAMDIDVATNANWPVWSPPV